MNPRRIVLAGGRGFLGALLARHLVDRHHEVVVLSRRPQPDDGPIRRVTWDGRSVGDWAAVLHGARAVINLAGHSVNCRYTARNRRRILDSRVDSTRVLGEAIGRCQLPPRVWLNSSTATIYRHTFGPPWDETGEIGASPEARDAFSVEVATAWERVFHEAPTPGTRKVALRTAMVLGSGNAPNNVVRVLRRLVRIGLGGRMGRGDQFVSWIHEADYCRAVEWLIERPDFSGPVNLCAPNPVTNRELMRTFRDVCGAPLGVGLPATRWMLEIGAFLLRTETELILKSRRAVPGRLTGAGFTFRFPHLRAAVADLSDRPAA
jgi:hypothetical protein